LCDELPLQPALFYRRQKEFFENGAAAFQTKPAPMISVALYKDGHSLAIARGSVGGDVILIRNVK
jgi:hypothetical protein